MRPTHNSRKRKQQHCNCNEPLTGLSKQITESSCNQSCILNAFLYQTGRKINGTGGKNDNCCHGTYYHRIGEHLEDTPKSLLYRLLYIGVGMHHNRGTKTCLIGEHTSLTAVLHRAVQNHLDHRTADAAGNRSGNKCKLKDGSKDCSNHIQMRTENNQ